MWHRQKGATNKLPFCLSYFCKTPKVAIINGNLNEFRDADDELIINGETNDEWEKCVESVCDCVIQCLRNVLRFII